MAIRRPRAYWPLTITANSNDAFQVAEAANSYTSAQLTAGTYVTPEALAAELVARINAVLGSPDVSYSIAATTGKITLTRTSGSWKINFNVSNSCGATVGFGTEEKTGGTTYTATNQMQNGWWSPVAVEFTTPGSRVRHAGSSIALNDKLQSVVWGSGERKEIRLAWLPKEKVYIDEEGSSTYQAIERLWKDGYAKFRWWPDQETTGTSQDLALDPRAIEEFRPERQYQTAEYYRVTLRCLEYVA